MKRRTLLQWAASAATLLPFGRLRLLAQPRELPAEAMQTLHAVAAGVLPASLGVDGIHGIADRFAAWGRGYREGVALAHGYGHPRLQKSEPSPASKYVDQLAALEAGARANGASFASLDLERKRALIDAALQRAGVRSLPPRPLGQHVVADLMAFYFRSSEANDECYRALIQREVCRPIQITTRKPEAKRA